MRLQVHLLSLTLFILACLTAPVSSHVSLFYKQSPIGATFLNYLRVPHGCKSGDPQDSTQYPTIGITAFFNSSFQTSPVPQEVPNYVATREYSAATGVTKLVWTAVPGYSLFGSNIFQLFGFSARINNAADQTVFFIPIHQRCLNNTEYFWNLTHAANALIDSAISDIAPSFTAFSPVNARATEPTMYGVTQLNVVPSSSTTIIASNDDDVTTARRVAIAAIVIACFQFLGCIGLFVWVKQKVADVELTSLEKQYKHEKEMAASRA